MPLGGGVLGGGVLGGLVAAEEVTTFKPAWAKNNQPIGFISMFKKNAAVTGFTVGLVSAADGSDITSGTPEGYYTLDGGAQAAIGDVTPVHEGNGLWSFDLLAAEMNGDLVGLTFTHASAITQHFTIKTALKLTSELQDIAATAIVSGGAIDTTAGAVDSVTLTATTAINTDMRGTDNAALAVNVPDVVSLANINAQCDTALADYDGPTNAEMVARTILAPAYFDPAVDPVLLAATATSAKLVDDVLDEALAGHNIGGSFGKAIRQIKEGAVSVESSVNDAAATATSFVTALTEATNNHYKDVSVVFIDGALIGQSRPILSYDGATKKISLDEALTEAPANGDAFIIKTDHVHPITEIQDGLATTAELDARTLPAADYFNPAADTVANVTLVDTTTANTDMRGTDSAATAVNLAIVDNAVDSVKLDTVAIVDDTGVSIPAAISAVQGDTDNLQTRLPAALIDGRMDSDVEAINNSTVAAVNLSLSARAIVPLSVNDASATTTTFITSSTELTDDHYNGRIVVFTSGALINQATDITGYNGTTKAVTVTALTEAPANTDTFIII